MTEDQHFYIGIDLGTTNSSIHWGALNPNTTRIEPRPLGFDQQEGDGSIQRRVLLPSYIWFRQDNPIPVVGEYARKQGLEAQPSRVSRSVKNHMGQPDWRFSVDNKEYTATDLSAMLLKTMSSGIIKTWGRPVTDAIITVPASFDGDMREATLKSAEIAGFKVIEANGEKRNLLLDEPRAALYDFINQQLAGHLPPGICLDISTPKTVLVFDLGGGTLDVSLHRVKQSSDVDEIGVEDLAISRYTQLGGGVFDNLLANELQNRFEQRNKLSIENLPDRERYQIRIKLEVQAEQIKQRLTNDIEERILRGFDEIPGNFSIDVQMPFIYDNKGLFTRISKDEFEGIISSLLAPNLTVNDVEHFDRYEYSPDNIIFPILDVLHKAANKINGVPRVDTVILNGGMTRVHAIRQRLQDFFGIRPVTVLDPEHAVSRGAVVYHHLLHRGWRPRQILAESIGVEVHGGRVFHLVPAGTILPHRQIFKNQFSIPHDGADRLNIPLYRGERKTPEPPNKKILERQIIFTKPQTEGTSIDVEVIIDDDKIVSFTASLPDGERAIVRAGAESLSNPPSHASAQTNKQPKQGQPPPLPTGPWTDPVKYWEQYRSLASDWNETGLRNLGSKALAAQNVSEIMAMLIEKFNISNRPARQRTMWLIGEFGEQYQDHELIPRIVQACINGIRSSLGNEKAIATIGRNAVVALGKIGSSIAESHLISALEQPTMQPIRSDVLISIGKCGNSINSINYIGRYLASEFKGERIGALWALGRLGSRERSPVLPIESLYEYIPAIGQCTSSKLEKHIIARKYATYALGEIGDRRVELTHSDVVDKGHAEYIIMVLTKLLEDTTNQALKKVKGADELRQTMNIANIAIKQVKGESLTAEENRVLMSVRTLMSVSGE